MPKVEARLLQYLSNCSKTVVNRRLGWAEPEAAGAGSCTSTVSVLSKVVGTGAPEGLCDHLGIGIGVPLTAGLFFSLFPITTAFSWQSTFEKWCFHVEQATESRIRSYKPGVGQVFSPTLYSVTLPFCPEPLLILLSLQLNQRSQKMPINGLWPWKVPFYPGDLAAGTAHRCMFLLLCWSCCSLQRRSNCLRFSFWLRLWKEELFFLEGTKPLCV